MKKKLFVKYFEKNIGNVVGIVLIVLVLLALNMLSGNFGLFNPLLMRFMAFWMLLGVVLVYFLFSDVYSTLPEMFKGRKYWRALLGLSFLVFSFVVSLGFEDSSIWISGVPVLLSGLYLLRRNGSRKKNVVSLLMLVSFVYAVFFVFMNNVPWLWAVFHRLSLWCSQGVGLILGKSLILGPSASGLWILLLFVIFNVSVFVFSKRKVRKLIIVLASLVLIWVLYLVSLALISFNEAVDVVNFQYVLFLLGLIPTLIYFYWIKKWGFLPKKINLVDKRFAANMKKVGVWLIILVFLMGFILMIFVGGNSASNNIVINRKGMMAGWTRPEYGVYGRHAGGMFGFLPKHLDELGYDVQVLDENITANVFENTSTFVVINLEDAFNETEHGLIWDFVEQGGSLLVLGDHTDIGGMMRPLNNLLEPVGIRFRFDSALPLKWEPQWLWCMHMFHHPTMREVSNEKWVSISVGASLDVGKNSFPVLVGRYAFSDWGDYLNEGSYLGDYTHNPDEQLGDVILAAGAFYGDGRVLVFGDTSSFQNTGMSYSYHMVDNVFKWLNGGSGGNTVGYVQIVLPLVFLVGSIVIFLVSKSKKKKGLFVFLPVVFCVALIVSSFVNPVIAGQPQVEGGVFFIDASHGERFTLDMFKDASVSGLTINLGRNNYSSFILPSFDEELISGSEGLVLIAPTKEFMDDEIAFMKQYMYQGGLVIVSTGYQNYKGSAELLNDLGLRIQNLPLGPVPYMEEASQENLSQPKFVDSWPIEYQNDANTSVFYSIKMENTTYNLVVFKRYGEGGLLLISDRHFLLDENLESMYDRWPGNVQFFKSIIETLQNRGVLS